MNPFRLFPDKASHIARDIDLLYGYLWTVSAFFTLLIFVLVVTFAIRYRRRSANEPAPRQILGSVKLELLWAGIPFLFVMSFFIWGTRLVFWQYVPPKDTLDIYVSGKQWMWKTQHPSGVREINSLHVPLGQPVKLIISAQDVIHSFYIPAFRVKADAVPGRYTSMWFIPTKVGEYHLFCAEYCGTLHSKMIGSVTVMEPDVYEAWIAGKVVGEPAVAAGFRHYQALGCMTCHAAQAPTMAGLYGRRQKLTDGREVLADENYLRESILNSTEKIVAGYQPIMPSYRGQITEEQLAEMIAYIKSLADARQDTPTTRPSLEPERGGAPPRRSAAPQLQQPGGGK